MSQVDLQLASLLRLAAQPPPLGRIVRDASLKAGGYLVFEPGGTP